jgi:protein ImuB
VTSADGAARRVLVVWCPAWEQDPELDARAFEQVVTVVEGFCPRVEVLRPGACAIGARGPARYFGGEGPLARKITDVVACLGLACQVGVADGLFAAQLAARVPRRTRVGQHGRPGWSGPGRDGAPDAAVIVAPGGTAAFLAPHPVGSLGDPELADLLSRLGVRTLGEFAALPAAEVANRFGFTGALAHQLARGLDPRPLVPRPPSTDLSASVAFDPPAEQAEPVVFAAKALAEQMHADLAARGLACVRVHVQVTCSDGQEITRLWRHDGLLSSLAVAERVRWQLAGWRAAQDARGHSATAPGRLPFAGEGIQAGGITLLRLVPDQLVRNTGRQLGLWGEAPVDDRVARAALRVQAMLGHDSVARPLLAGGRSPADQVTLVPFGDAADPLFPAGRPWPGRLPAPAPATVYPVPRSAMVTDESGAVVTVTGRALISAPPAWLSAHGQPWLAITSWSGPWPVTERWWRPASSRRQARFQLVAEDGSAWLAVVQDGQWLIEASYDLLLRPPPLVPPPPPLVPPPLVPPPLSPLPQLPLVPPPPLSPLPQLQPRPCAGNLPCCRRREAIKNFFEKYRNYWLDAAVRSVLTDTVVSDKA